MRRLFKRSTGLMAVAAVVALGVGLGPAQAQDREDTDRDAVSSPTFQRPTVQQMPQQRQIDPQVLQQQRQIDPQVLQQRPRIEQLQRPEREGPAHRPIGMNDLPEWLARTPLVRDISQQYALVDRPGRAPLDTEQMRLTPSVEMPDAEEVEQREAAAPSLAQLQRQNRQVGFEFYDMNSSRTFAVMAPRARLAGFAREINELIDQTDPQGEPVPREAMEQEARMERSWSQRTDNRTRRGIADGWPDTSSIYQRMADYGGCSANVLVANSQRMIAITAAHCVFTAGGGISNSKLRPRRDGGESPTWGSWTVYGYGYYPQFLNNDCDDNFAGVCIRHDIALVFARPDSGASVPRGMGWAYRPKSYLNNRSAYRRGYPGCSYGHSPAGCTTNTLYGDGDVHNRYFRHPDGDGWNRQFQFSSDINPGDSGSGLYYYNNGFPYVYGVTSAERTCYQNCRGRTPNFGRRITAEFFDFINSVR